MAVDDKFVCIKDLRPGMKNVTCRFIVIDRGSTKQTKDGSVVRKCCVADQTGSINFSVWNEQAEAIEAGDILQLVKGYTSLWKGSMVIYSGKYGTLEKIGEFTMLFSEEPNMSDPNHDFVKQFHQASGPSTGTNRARPGSFGGNRNGNNRTGLGTPTMDTRVNPDGALPRGQLTPSPHSLLPQPGQLNSRAKHPSPTDHRCPVSSQSNHPHMHATPSPQTPPFKAPHHVASHQDEGVRFQPYPPHPRSHSSRPGGSWT